MVRFLSKVDKSCITAVIQRKIGDEARNARFFFSYVGSDVKY